MSKQFFKFDDIPPDSKVRFLPESGSDIFFVKVWKIEVNRSNDLSEGLALNEIPYKAYLNRDRGTIVFHFENEEDYTMAKFLI